MREILYAFYKDAGYEVLVMTAICELLVKEKGKFINNRLKITDSSGINNYEQNILSKVFLGRLSKYRLSDYHKWVEYLMQYCFKEKLCRQGIFKVRKTNKFHQAIIDHNINTFDPVIVRYIASKDISVLKSIFEVGINERNKYNK